eukprot:6970817-Pyramimonas_sp.AAC.2
MPLPRAHAANAAVRVHMQTPPYLDEMLEFLASFCVFQIRSFWNTQKLAKNASISSRYGGVCTCTTQTVASTACTRNHGPDYEERRS